MSQKKSETIKKTILLVEDDSGIAEQLVNRFHKYKKYINIITAQNAGEVIDTIGDAVNHRSIDAILLDLMMPYGKARPQLDGKESDPDETDTGLRLLEFLRREEKRSKTLPMWVAIITARSPFTIATRAIGLLEGHGEVYYKPFKTFKLEDDLATALNIPSQVPPILLRNNLSNIIDMEDLA
jgi:CheY-like chemotaxis protein